MGMNKRRSSGLAAAAVTLLLASGAVATALPAYADPALAPPSGLDTHPVSSWWGTNGRVTDTKLVGSRVYLAGAFDYIGPQTGYASPVAAATGTVNPSRATVDGIVRASAPDGAGGWYLVGDFVRVGGVSRRGAAQVDATGAVTRWNPNPNASVSQLVVLPDRVVVSWTTQGTARFGAYDRDRGARLGGWTGTANGAVSTMVAAGQGVYVGGSFSSIGGVAAAHVARLSVTTGVVDPDFSAAGTTGAVTAMATSADGSTLYVGGTIGAAGSGSTQRTRSNLAAFSTATGAVTDWAPTTNAAVETLATDPATQTVYVGGQFTSLGGSPRTAVGAVSANGAVTAFDPQLSGCNAPHETKDTYTLVPCIPEVDATAVRDGVLYLGGRFGTAGAVVRHNAAAFALGSSTPTGWDPVPSGQVLSIAPAGDEVFLGGDLTSVNGLVRRGLAALDATTGAGDPSFRADADNIVVDLELAPDGKRLYAMGSFATLGGFERHDIAALSLPSGQVDQGFKAQANNTAIVGKAAGNALYVGGTFARVNNVVRSHLVKVDGATGAVDPTFVVNTSGPVGPLKRGGMVQGLAVRSDASRVYLAGPFTSANGQAVTGGLLVVDGTTGARTPAQLGGQGKACGSAGQWITQLNLTADQKYVYGGDTCPDNIYKWDAVNMGTPANPTGLAWMTWCNAGMQATVEAGGHLFYASHGGNRNAGGYCWASPSDHTNLPRQRLVELDAATGSLTTKSYFFDSPMGAWSLAVLPQGLLVGGDFTHVGDRSDVHQGLALLPGTP